jgi:hypothetical protein
VKFIGVFICSIFLFSAHAYGHPGKTDYRGGHKCWKNCSEWDLGYGEYHLHDEDWKPIRFERQGEEIQPPKIPDQEIPEPLEQTHVVATTTQDQTPTIIEKKEVVVNAPDIVVYEEGIIPFDAIFFLILAILLLIALIFIRKKRERN